MNKYYLIVGAVNGYGRQIVIEAERVRIIDGAYCFYNEKDNMFENGEFVASYPVTFTEITKVEKI